MKHSSGEKFCSSCSSGKIRTAGRRVAAGLNDARLKPIWLIVASGWVLFSSFRLGLFLAGGIEISELTGGQIARCFLMGMRYDAMAVGYAVLAMVLVLSLSPPRWFSKAGFRRLVGIYATAIVTAAVFVEIVGAAFFLRFGRRLNWVAISYLKHPKEVLGHIWNNYPLWLFVPGMAVLCYVVYRVIMQLFWRSARGDSSIRRRLIQALVLISLCVLACRGGFDRRPLRRGSAYFTSNFLVTQLTMNNFFTIFNAARDTIAEAPRQEGEYPYPPIDQAMKEVSEMLFLDGDRPIKDAGNPLWRRTSTGCPRKDYNVVVIIMEGMSGTSVGALGYNPSYTPNFDALCRKGIFCRRMYASGRRTCRAMAGILCSHPDIGGMSILERDLSQGTFLTLPSVFQKRGYKTLFVYGGDGGFDNMKGFFSAAGMETFICEDKMDSGKIPGQWNWGLPDEIILDKAAEEFDKLSAAKQNFFAVILTVSNHDPYHIPHGRIEELPTEDKNNLRLNAYKYSDWALGEFFRKIRTSSYFKNTVFVLVADHGHQLHPSVSIDVPGYRVPCLFYAPGIIKPRLVETVCSQTDIGPTLLGLLGGSFEHCFMGRNILKIAPSDGFAAMHQGDLGFVSGDNALVLPPSHKQADQPIPILFHTGWYRMDSVPPAKADAKLLQSLQRRMLSFFTVSRHLYLTRTYRRINRNPTTSGDNDD